MAKRIAILGSTGSIGRNALRVIEALGADSFGSFDSTQDKYAQDKYEVAVPLLLIP